MPPSRKTSNKDETEKRVLANRYQVEKKLGVGNFGTAFLVKDLRRSGEHKVLKEISVGELEPDETVDAMHEARLLSKLDNRGIVRFHDSFLDGHCFCIITEYCEGGDLDQKIASYKKQGKRFPESQVIEWTIDLLLAVQHMHSRRVLHRDLKTRNIFLKNNRVKIGDFGISRILMGTVDMASTFTGTPYYMSPEVLKHDGYNSKSDIWSIGCIVYELCSLEHAFEGQSLMGVMYKIVDGECPELPQQYSRDLSAFLKKLLTKDPELRPTAGEALRTPFLAKHLERLKEDLIDKQNQRPDNTMIANKEALELARELKKKSRLRDLQEEEEQIKFKNLSPRERMRIKKLQDADKKAQKLREAAKVNYLANQNRQRTRVDLKFSSNLTSSAQYASRQPPVARQTRSAQIDTSPSHGRSPSPHEYYYDQEEDDYDDEGTILQPVPPPHRAPPPTGSDDDDIVTGGGAGEGTLKSKSSRMMQSGDSGVVTRDASLNDVTLKAAASYDDRPIQPMKDTMVYSREHSSLDFEDGIPDKADLAESFYSQYDDFEDEGAVDAGEEEGFSDDEQGLIESLQNVLEQTGDGAMMRTQTINDDQTVDAYGPAARQEKIRNMRTKCVRQLGEDIFNKVYNHIKDFRSKNKNDNDSVMMKGLKNLIAKPADAFDVDQLVFMESES